MQRADILKLQQIEFFLLHNLIVDELQLLRRSKRMTPARRPNSTEHQRMALIGGLFRSFLTKVFPSPFRVSKRAYFQEFTVSMDSATRERLRRANVALPDLCRTLQPTADEIGTLRFDFPNHLTIAIALSRRYRHRYGYNMEVADMGIGRHCLAVNAVMAWRKRLDAVLEGADAEEMVGPPEPVRNHAQEQLEAVLRGAAEAGRI